MNFAIPHLTFAASALAVSALLSACGGGASAPPAASQTISFNPATTGTVGIPITLSATATSGLAVSFTTSTPSVCTVSASTLTLLSTGTCTVKADQNGNDAYAAATQVSKQIEVSAPTAITFASAYSAADADTVNYSRAGRSVEGGAFNWYQAPTAPDWSAFWYNGVSPITDPNPNFAFVLGLPQNTATPFIGAFVNAPNDGSITLNGQTKLQLSVWGNPELTSRGVPTFSVFVQLKQSYSGCYVEVAHPTAITPSTNGAQTYELPLADFTIKNNCDGSGVTTAAQALAQPIGSVHVQVLKENMQFAAAGDTSNPVRFPNAINVGPISFRP